MKPNVPLLTKVLANVSLFSVKLARIARAGERCRSRLVDVRPLP
jgi:hypothetical protein